MLFELQTVVGSRGHVCGNLMDTQVHWGACSTRAADERGKGNDRFSPLKFLSGKIPPPKTITPRHHRHPMVRQALHPQDPRAKTGRAQAVRGVRGNAGCR